MISKSLYLGSTLQFTQMFLVNSAAVTGGSKVTVVLVVCLFVSIERMLTVLSMTLPGLVRFGFL